MRLEHRFVVPAPVEEAWAAFHDLERVVPCFPGATLTTHEGDEFTGSCKVKLGPVSLQYTGHGTFVDRDAVDHRAVIEAKGKDRRGNGTASVHVTARLTAAGDSSTDVMVESDLIVTGRPAQFGRGLIQEVSDKLLDQFVACLSTRLGAPTTPEPAASPGAAAAAGSAQSTSAQFTSAQATSAQPTSAQPTSAQAESVQAESAPAAASESVSAGWTTGGSSPTGAPRVEHPPPPGFGNLDLGSALIPVLARRARPYIIGAVLALVIRRLIRR